MNKEKENKSKNKNKTLNLIFGIIIGLLLASSITLATTTIHYKNLEPQVVEVEKTVEVEKIVEVQPKEASGLLRATVGDSTLVENGGYIMINDETFDFDMPESRHELMCKRLLTGGETIKIHTAILCHIVVLEYEDKKSESTTLYDSGFDAVDEYSFETKENMSYYIDLTFAYA